MLLQPFAHRLVIKLQCRPGDEQGNHQRTHGHQYMRAEGSVRIALRPRGVHVYQRIVRDVERIGYVAQELADAWRLLSSDGASGTDGQHQREHEKDADQLIDAVHYLHATAQGRHTQHDENHQGGHPEATVHLDSPSQPAEQQAHEERIEQAHPSDIDMLGIEHEAANYREAVPLAHQEAEEVQAKRQVGGKDGRKRHEASEGNLRQMAEHQGIEHIGGILEHQCPDGSVDAGQLSPSTDVHGRWQRNHAHQQKGLEKNHPPSGTVHLVEQLHTSGIVEETHAHQHTENHHGVKSCHTALEEVLHRHLVPTVIVGIADDEAAQGEEEIHGQIAMREKKTDIFGRITLHEVIEDHHQGGHPSQSIQNFVSGFAFQVLIHKF